MANARPNNFRRPSSTKKRGRKVNPCKKRNPSAAVKKALSLSERFHQLMPRRIRTVNIRWPKALVRIGGAAQLNYLSDKYNGKLKEYWHRFTGPATVYTSERPQADGSNLLIIKGKFKIKSEGIVG